MPLEIPLDNFKGTFNVFISHKFVPQDQELALNLREELRKGNVEGYLAEGKREYDLLIGDKIKEAIDKSEHVIAIITKQSQTSASVNQELGYALGTNKPIVIMIEKDMQQGVLTHGRDPEEFVREMFSESCKNAVKYILYKHSQKKISNTSLELIPDIYKPLYNELFKIDDKAFLKDKLQDPFSVLDEYSKLKTDSKTKEKFEILSSKIKVWNSVYGEK